MPALAAWPADSADSLTHQAVTASGLPKAAGATDEDRIVSQNEAIVQSCIFARERSKDPEYIDVFKEHQITWTASTGDTNHRFIDVHVRSFLTDHLVGPNPYLACFDFLQAVSETGEEQVSDPFEVTMAGDMQHIIGQLLWAIPQAPGAWCHLHGVVAFVSQEDIRRNYAHWENLFQKASLISTQQVTMTLEACYLQAPTKHGLPVHSQITLVQLIYPPNQGDVYFSQGHMLAVPAITDTEAWTSRGGLSAGQFRVVFAT